MKKLQSHIEESKNLNESLSNIEQEILTESLVSSAHDFKNGTVKIDEITPLFRMSEILKVKGGLGACHKFVRSPDPHHHHFIYI
jgi:hypothetical protein